MRHFSGKSSATITPSAKGRKMLLEMGIGSEIIPNAVDTGRFVRMSGSRFLAEKVGTENIVLVAGRIIKEKNLDSALEAAARMGKEAAFVFVGSGPYENSLRKKAERMGLLGRNVFFLGRVGDAELVACYSEASLLFFPSTYDTFGLVCVEAMLCGLPVVAPDGSAQAEIEGIAGYAPGKELEAIRAALSKGRVTEGIVEGLRKRFGKRQVAKEHIEAYERTMG
jgi:glycosyltransferase involved in cell wall biosynthesis